MPINSSLKVVDNKFQKKTEVIEYFSLRSSSGFEIAVRQIVDANVSIYLCSNLNFNRCGFHLGYHLVLSV